MFWWKMDTLPPSPVVKAVLYLDSVPICGTSRQDAFSLQVGTVTPGGLYVYKSSPREARISRPYRYLMLDQQSTSVITPQHLDAMLAEIVGHHFNEKIEPIAVASNMNWDLYQKLYKSLVRQ